MPQATYVAWANAHLAIGLRPAARDAAFDRYRVGLHHLALRVRSRDEVDASTLSSCARGAMSGRDTPRSEPPLTGRCHCGNLELALETSRRPEELSLRADTCSFCRRHGARTTSDPSGRVVITVHHPEQLVRYRFGLETADFLVCARCGIYVTAVMKEGSSAYATVNVNTLDAVDHFTQAATPVTYEGESAAERTARRRARWTPALVVEER